MRAGGWRTRDKVWGKACFWVQPIIITHESKAIITYYSTVLATNERMAC